MNALVRKEIRLILPAWALAMVLAILPVWLLWPSSLVPIRLERASARCPGLWAVCAGCIAARASPVWTRTQLWHVLDSSRSTRFPPAPLATKTMVVGLASDRVCRVEHVRLRSRDDRDRITVNFLGLATRALNQIGTQEACSGNASQGIFGRILYGTLVYGGLSALAAFAGGLWTNLLFRNTSAAFWFSLLIPLGFGCLFKECSARLESLANIALDRRAGSLLRRWIHLGEEIFPPSPGRAVDGRHHFVSDLVRFKSGG